MAQHFNLIEDRKMKSRISGCFVICVGILLAACSVGNGRICGPQTPRAYCDGDAYQRLAHPKPYLEEWNKVGTTVEERKKNWIQCGGANNGSFSPYTNDFEKEKRNGEKDDLPAYSRLDNKLQQCMIKNGYSYIGSCENEIMKTKPACVAP